MNAYLVLSYKNKELGNITSKGSSREQILARARLMFGPCKLKEDK